MTMQTTTLPFQVSGASALAQPQRNAAAGVQAPEAGSSAFGATLSREISQRQAMTPTSAPAPAPATAPAGKPAAAKQQAAEKAPAQGPKAAAREPARQKDASSDAAATAQSGAAAGAASADGAEEAAGSAEAASAAAQAASAPVTDMLAFMASLMQAAPVVPAVPSGTAASALVATDAAGADAAGAALQLAALQSAFAKLDTAGAAAPGDPALADAAEGDASAAGFSLAAGVQPAEPGAAELRAQQQPVQQAVPAGVQDQQGKFQLPAAEAGVQAAAAVEAPAPSVTQLQAQATKLETMMNPAAPGDRIPARVGTPAWDNQVSQRIVYMVGKEQAATLTLNPPDLGPVQVVLNVSNEGASVAFSSNQLEVRQALENALPRLREMMGESGIALGNATVDAGMPDGRQAQQDGERGNGQRAGGSGSVAGATAAQDDGAARPAVRTVALGDSGMVDTFA